MNYINSLQILYSYLSLAELKDRLKENITSIHTMIDSMSDEELFQPHMRKWADDATKTAIWKFTSLFTLILLLLSELLELRLEMEKGSIVNLSLSELQNMI